MKKLKLFLSILFSIPKTLYLNFVCFPFHVAIRFPVLISYRVSVKNICRGGIVIEGTPRFAFFKFGFDNGSFEMAKKSNSYLNITNKGTLILRGKLSLSNGAIINVGGTLIFGKNFTSNANLKISCEKGITFGDDVLIGWNCTFIDGDGHSILSEQGVQTNEAKEVLIGTNTWICAEASIFKGTTIPNGSVVSYGSQVSKQFFEENCLIGGSPAKILKQNIRWER